MTLYDHRLQRLREIMNRESITAFLITKPENRFYLTGFTGTSGSVLLTPKDIFLITDFRYDQQAKEQSPHTHVLVATDNIYDTLSGAPDTDLSMLGVEGDYMTHQHFCVLRDRFRNHEIRPLLGKVEEVRVVKDPQEIDRLAASAALSDRAMAHIFPMIAEGVTEQTLSLEIEFFFKRNGAQGLAFNMIVASGVRSAMPHGTATQKKLCRGELLTLDFGALLNGYNSDITRTVAVGSKDKKMDQIYQIVLEAQLTGLDAVREGIAASEVDKAVRNVIEKHGYGDYFGHSTGHGVGLEIHENPRLSSRDNTLLKKGMVVTVEPGIYLPGWGGVRIEDTVIVEERGCRILTSTPKNQLAIWG